MSLRFMRVTDFFSFWIPDNWLRQFPKRPRCSDFQRAANNEIRGDASDPG